jgi:hypothetical protein
MTIQEAKRIAEKNGYKIKEGDAGGIGSDDGGIDVGRGTPMGRCLTRDDIEDFALKVRKHLKYLARTGDGRGTFKFKQASGLLKTLENQQFV